MNAIAGLYNRRVRGFRIINFAAIILLLVMMFGLYWAKTRASGDSAAIAKADREIAAQNRDIRLLEAKVAGLEQPERIRGLSQDYLHLAPLKAAQETAPGGLAALGHHPAVPAVAPAVAAPGSPPVQAAAPPKAAVAAAPPLVQQASR